ncbi:MAG: DedA family protein [Candidatus Sungiibacteriota bacterium]|uniref:DedA family protein n=1 Tax=Candidatus Sungiibacteriota bacterium TaxID=2750080 RepID=A0A7T5RK04_9BACT|nr:MAG: DedA family protein [Candidatus Sungbacteria bacterium]
MNFALAFLPLESISALYVVLFLLPVLSSVFLPVPEEVALLIAGYLAYLGFVNFWAVLVVMFLGVIAGDIVGYFLGRYFGDWLSQNIINRVPFAAHLLGKAKHYFDRYGERVVLFSRPLLSIRMIVPMMAGHFRMNLAKFLFYDVLISIVWVGAVVSVSYFLGSGLDLITEVREIKHAVFAIIGLIIIFYAVIRFIKNNKNAGLV